MKKVFRPTWWQCAQSYVAPVWLEQASSAYNPQLDVVLRRGRLQLLTENAIYSYADLYDNFSKVFDKLPFASPSVGRVLVLGFGLGSIPFMLEKKYKQNFDCVGVEIDAEIVRLVQKYVLPDVTANIQLFCGDAADFVAKCTTQFDMICVDLFLDAIVPSPFGKVDFLENLKKMLAPKGVLIYNKLAYAEKDKMESTQFFHRTFKQVFEKAILFDVGGNYMLLNQDFIDFA